MKTLGPPNARILILTDYPSKEEFLTKTPLSGWAGERFFSVWNSVGLMKSTTFIMSFLDEAPLGEEHKNIISRRKTCPGVGWRFVNGAWVAPSVGEAHQRLLATLERVQPSIVVTLGPAALFALTGDTNSLKWRGSRLTPPEWPFTIVPTLAPRVLLTAPENIHLIKSDLTRVLKIFTGAQLPRKYDFTIYPPIETATAWLADLEERAETSPLLLSGDLETRNHHISCFGIADSPTRAICLPFLKFDGDSPFPYSPDDEVLLVDHIHRLFRHPNITWVGQNFLYDCQYFNRFWLASPVNCRDTMIGHHSIHSNTRKGLDFLSSIYSHDHVYWKDEINDWAPDVGEFQYWTYNCKDACITWEIWTEILNSAREKGISP
jgi:uracil-DNA glycosylase